MKSIVSMGLLFLLGACAEPVQNQHASVSTRDVMRRKTIHSPYIAATHPYQPRLEYLQTGEYRNYGLVEVPSPIASGSAGSTAPAPSDLTPTGAHRTVINQVTNEPVR